MHASGPAAEAEAKSVGLSILCKIDVIEPQICIKPG